MSEVSRRALALLTLLQSGRRYTAGELADRLGVGDRTVRRDVERLRGHGYEIEGRPGPDGHYRLVRGSRLPPLVLDDDEAVAVSAALGMVAATGDGGDGLGEAAARAYERIDQFLPRRLHRRVAALREGVHVSPVAAPAVSPAVLADLADAIRDRRIIGFEYARGERVSNRTVEPHRLVHRHLAWYLVAWDVDRGDWRTFRVHRLSNIDVDTHGRAATFEVRPLPGGSVDAYLDEGFRRDRVRVVVTVAAARDDVAAALAYQDASLTPLDETTTRAELYLDDWRWLVLALAFLDAGFVIDEPAEFAAAAAAFGRRLTSVVDGGASPV